MSELAIIDYAIIVVYMGGVLFVGSYFARYVSSAGDLFLGGRSLPFWAIGMSMVVSDIGATDLINGAGAACLHTVGRWLSWLCGSGWGSGRHTRRHCMEGSCALLLQSSA